MPCSNSFWLRHYIFRSVIYHLSFRLIIFFIKHGQLFFLAGFTPSDSEGYPSAIKLKGIIRSGNPNSIFTFPQASLSGYVPNHTPPNPSCTAASRIFSDAAPQSWAKYSRCFEEYLFLSINIHIPAGACLRGFQLFFICASFSSVSFFRITTYIHGCPFRTEGACCPARRSRISFSFSTWRPLKFRTLFLL